MREKELRIALVCYGGISLAVYMHGITKEIWRLAKASQLLHADDEAPEGGTYRDLLRTIRERCDLDLRVYVDILAGASAGGINAVFLAHAIAQGRSVEPLTDLWLTSADVDKLLDPQVGRVSRFAKSAAVPIAWAFSKRAGTIDETVESMLVSESAGPEETLLAGERTAYVRAAVAALPDRMRSIVEAIYFDDRTVTEIADELGITHSAVSQQRSEAIRLMREGMATHYADDGDPAVIEAKTSQARRSAYLARLAQHAV